MSQLHQPIYIKAIESRTILEPLGISIDRDNNILLNYVFQENANWNIGAGLPPIPYNIRNEIIGKFSSDWTLTNYGVIDSISDLSPKPPKTYYSISIDSTDEVILISQEGTLYSVDSDTNTVSELFTLRDIPIDTTSIFDITTNKLQSFEGLISTKFATYGDIAVLERDNTLDLLIAGKYQITPFIVRLRWEDRNFQGAKVMVASQGTTAGNINLTRGVTVNNDGTVLTTLPINIQDTDLIPEPLEDLYGGFYDVPVAFNIDYPETGDFSPQLMKIDSSSSGVNRQGFTDIASQGMDVDSQGNFYIVTNSTGSTALNITGEGNLLVIDKNLNQVISVGSIDKLATTFRDVAVDSNGQNAYVTVSMNNIFNFNTDGEVVKFDLQQTKSLLENFDDQPIKNPNSTNNNDQPIKNPNSTNNNNNNNNGSKDSLLNTTFNRFSNQQIPGTYLFATEGESVSIRQNFSNVFSEDGKAFKVATKEGDNLVRFNRFANLTIPGTYLFATEGESVSIRQKFADVFREEGIAFYTYSSNANLGTDYYRLANTKVPGTYIFVNQQEKDQVLVNFPQFVNEGIAFEVG